MKKLNVAILQHSDNTPPGTCVEWLEARGHSYFISQLHKGEPLPDLTKVDWLIILGGPMNVDDLAPHPWLVAEKKLLAAAIEGGKSCLGLCLGGQLLAQTLGGIVGKNKHWEVGWKNVDVIGEKSLKIFQYHQDQFSLPPGAERLATNEITANQAFRFKEHVIGIQFHPESTEDWVRYCARDKALPPTGPYVDTPEQIVDGIKNLPTMKAWFFGLLEKMEHHCLARAIN